MGLQWGNDWIWTFLEKFLIKVSIPYYFFPNLFLIFVYLFLLF